MAKRASVLRRRKSKSKMDVSASEAASITRRNSDEDVVFYMEESRSGIFLQIFLNFIESIKVVNSLKQRFFHGTLSSYFF